MNEPDTTTPIATSPAPNERAFVIEHRRTVLTPSTFEPQARICVMAALRTSGLLSRMSDEQARTLLTLLTFLTPNGAVQASAWQLAMALTIREGKAKERLERLSSLRHEGQSVAFRLERESGPTVYSLSRLLVANEEEPQQPQEDQRAVIKAAGREAVIARSREKYAVPRQEAERMVAEQYAPVVVKTDANDASPEAGAKRALRALGVLESEIEHLLANYPLAEIERQVAWLPARNARDPKRLIVAAIKGRYEPPLQRSAQQQQQQEHWSAPEQQQRQDAGEPTPVTVSLPIPEAIEATAAEGTEAEAATAGEGEPNG